MRAPAFAAALAFSAATTGLARGQPIPVAAPAPGATSAPAPASAPPAASPGAAAAEPPAPAPSGPGPAAPPSDLPPGYYVDQGGPPPPPAGAEEPKAPRARVTYEFPPLDEDRIFEPPPPPPPKHVSPRNALWLGVRLGWFVPFGSAYARGVEDPESGIPVLVSVPWKDYVSSGPSVELDAGARLGRNYNLFALWERAFLGSGNAEAELRGGQKGGDTDYFALGLRATSNADELGFITELALGYRQARAAWDDGTEYRMTGGVLEGRLSIGADLRVNPMLTVGPMLALGVGSFDRFRVVVPGGASYDLIGPNDAPGGHAWLSLTVGGHVDLLGSK